MIRTRRGRSKRCSRVRPTCMTGEYLLHLSGSCRDGVSFALRLLNRQRLPSTRVVREVADPYSDDEVSEGYERVQGTWKENPITEESEQIVVSFLPVFHGLLDRLVDAIPLRIVPDWLCRHPLVESDDEGVHRGSDQDYPRS